MQIIKEWAGLKAWDAVGKLQFDKLVDEGLKPEHKLLDIGCGMLRAGKRLIPYLNTGNYYGVEKNQGHINSGKTWLIGEDITTEGSHISVNENFNFAFDESPKFDFIIAHSLFPHLQKRDIEVCLRNAKEVMADGCKFFATFFEGEVGTITWDKTDKVTITHDGQDPYHHKFEVLSDLAKEVGLVAEYIGEWDHPREQRLLMFRKYATGGIVTHSIGDGFVTHPIGPIPDMKDVITTTSDDVPEDEVQAEESFFDPSTPHTFPGEVFNEPS